ncbi:stage III sporulation protein AA [Candidatus Frackibacter sp. WG13]|uniref:stage III sporulation protein AA n=1 Tax=Candidatus Frackibacter sp. WG13 TaxID=2017978 RepID=UPI000792AD8A|nr:stage III sporulation protein AA [Candidatus Frackibacter sp. WG13]KXS45950.1 MAG: stage III sporulation protein AA [Candidatus Frackibacter sp. T328-2]SFL80469.1 stage III sporulation protein AA [Candidatus Frackibacter sp. WG13]
MANRIQKEILPVLANSLRRIIERIDLKILSQIEEIRLRVNQPLILNLNKREVMLTKRSEVTSEPKQAYHTTQHDLQQTMNIMTQNSLYALEEELKEGYLTLKGGHRVGFVGRVISNSNKIELIKDFSGLNIRISQEIIGAADSIIKKLIFNRERVYNTLIISPPQCGKTTLLRDIIRQLSNGIPQLNFSGLKVGVVDERGELGGTYQGIAQNQLGIRTDLLANCPKSEGMLLLIRSMSPEVIITDEIGSQKDVQAIKEAINAGVKIITSVHGQDLNEIKERPNLKELLKHTFFKRFIILSRRRGPGTIERVLGVNEEEIRFKRRKGCI